VVVEVPVIAIEEFEQPLEGFVGDVDVRVGFFQLVDIEKAAIEVRHIADESRQIGVTGRFS
jgi:hypothetical protein